MPKRRVALQANNGQWVCAEGGGGRELVANRSVPDIWEMFTIVDLGGGQVALRAHDGNYVCADIDTRRQLTADRAVQGPWEVFTLIDHGSGVISMVSHTGKHVCAEAGGGRELIADRDDVGPWEQFGLLDIPHDPSACKALRDRESELETKIRQLETQLLTFPGDKNVIQALGASQRELSDVRLRLELDC